MSEELETPLKTADGSAPETMSGLPSRYEARGIIGRGGMGVVFRARDLQLDRDVAIKVLSFEGSKDSKVQERFLKEAKTLVLLNHPNIVKLLSSGIDENGNLYLVMEFIAGLPLSQSIGNGKRLAPQRFFQVFLQILSGLQYAHSQGVVHRDLKPGNFIISEEAEVLHAKIIDFGIAKIEEEDAKPGQGLTKTGAVMGSPKYMSPEQCKGAKADRLSDIYSIACVMFEAISGTAPFEAESVVDLMYKHCMEKAPRLYDKSAKEASRRMSDLLEQCMQKDPDGRPQSIEEIIKQLNVIFEQTGGGKDFITAGSKQKDKSPIMFTLLSIVLIAVLVCIPVLLSKNSKQAETARASANVVKSEKLASLQADAKNLKRIVEKRNESYIQKITDPQERKDKAKTAVEHVVDLATAQRELGDFDEAEKTLRKGMQVCKYVDNRANRQFEAELLKEIACCRMGKEDYVSVEKFLQDAIALPSTNMCKAEIKSVNVQVDLLQLNFSKAQSDFQKLRRAVYEYEKKGNDIARKSHAAFENNLAKRQGITKVQSIILKYIKGLSALLEKIQLKSSSERLAALQFCNSMLETCLIEEADLSDQIKAQSQALFKTINSSTAGYAEAAAKSKQLWEQTDSAD